MVSHDCSHHDAGKDKHRQIRLFGHEQGACLKSVMVSPAISIAVMPSPGIPRAIMGIRAPPREALLAVSEAHTPAGFPFPKLSGSLL